MVICADTSFLFSLYGHDSNTPRALAWVNAAGIPITITLLNGYELGNALRFAEFRKGIGVGEAALFWMDFDSDQSSGRLLLQVCNLVQVFEEARRLSVSRTLAGGHRGFDILHVAAALRLGATWFLTFDGNQKKLAEAEGLAVPI